MKRYSKPVYQGRRLRRIVEMAEKSVNMQVIPEGAGSVKTPYWLFSLFCGLTRPGLGALK
jgi:hypothetical protein